MEKTPRFVPYTEDGARKNPSWRFSRMEMIDPFGWHSIDRDALFEVQGKLSSFESMTWNEIFVVGNKQNHGVSPADLCREAQVRLEDLRLDDVEKIYSLRIGGKPRVYGILIQDVYHLLWWDPEHQVCPSVKKGT